MWKQKKAAYTALGLSELATKEEVKKAYRQKCKLFHPDLNADVHATKQYLLVQKAYHLIMEMKWYRMEESNSSQVIAEKWTPSTCEGKVMGGWNLKHSDETQKQLKEWKEKREQLIREKEERKKKILAAQKPKNRLPSQREAEKWRKIEIEREAERIACLIKELLKLENMKETRDETKNS